MTLTEFVDEIANELDGTCDSVDWMMTKHEVAFEVGLARRVRLRVASEPFQEG